MRSPNELQRRQPIKHRFRELDGAIRKKKVLQPCSTKSLTQAKRISDDDCIRGGKPRRIDLEKSTVEEEQERKIPEGRPLTAQLEGTNLVSSNDDSKRPRVTFILDKACLQKGVVGKTAKILNSDEHADFLLKKKKNLDDFRPDILYRALLAIFDSPLGKAGLVQAIYVKIDNGVLFEVKPHVRIPRTIKRFNGLMLELLQKSYTKAKDTDEKLLRVIEQPVTRHLPENSRIIGLSYGSENLVNLNDYVAHVSDDINLVFVVGAMPHGTIDKLFAHEFISISNYPLSTSRCAGDICDALENVWDII